MKYKIIFPIEILIFFLAAAAFLASAHVPPQSGTNILQNGGFETWATTTITYNSLFGGSFSQTDTVLLPQNWAPELVFSCCVLPELGNVVSQGELNTGNFGLKLGGFFGSSLATGIYFYQDVLVIPGLVYKAAYHAKNPFPGDPNARRMRGTWKDSNGNPTTSAFFLPALATSTYAHIESPLIVAPCTAASIRVYLDKADFGGIAYDDAYLGASLNTPAVPCPVTIDIKPDSDPNAVNLKSLGVIPVAILSTSTFDAPQLINPATVTFANSPNIKHAAEDVNDDGFNDALYFFQVPTTNMFCGQTSAALNGQRFDGGLITGTDSIKTIGCDEP